jgi:hypothetical protein
MLIATASQRPSHPFENRVPGVFAIDHSRDCPRRTRDAWPPHVCQKGQATLVQPDQRPSGEQMDVQDPP